MGKLRSIDQNNNIITSFVNPFNYTLPVMKFVFTLVALALIAASDAAPAQEVTETLEGAAEAGTYSGAGGETLFVGGLDDIQGAVEDIESAAAVLDNLETQLSTLDSKSGDVIAAEKAIEAAVDASAITNAFST